MYQDWHVNISVAQSLPLGRALAEYLLIEQNGAEDLGPDGQGDSCTGWSCGALKEVRSVWKPLPSRGRGILRVRDNVGGGGTPTSVPTRTPDPSMTTPPYGWVRKRRRGGEYSNALDETRISGVHGKGSNLFSGAQKEKRHATQANKSSSKRDKTL